MLSELLGERTLRLFAFMGFGYLMGVAWKSGPSAYIIAVTALVFMSLIGMFSAWQLARKAWAMRAELEDELKQCHELIAKLEAMVQEGR